ncbi:FYN-binding protein 2 isoform X2 [Erinaceus europaeus]|uniref:FYN-binding protein 2 isoform X2 n=1 Tax=Erinaceus europaeus TaxID=9365 RepID=A0ABM3YME7_ERIEU|nr:FYN-binding protein 2 isoform X2 [Erinaceus europaeus]
METRVCSEGTQKAPAPGEGGAAAAQVGQVRSQRSGVFGANAYRTGAQQTLGPRILLWEAGFVSLTLPRKKIMEGEGLRNFQELRAKFQHLDVPSLSRPIKFPAGISAKGNTGSTQSTGTLVSGTPLSSNHWRLPYCPSKMSQSLTSQKMKVTQQSERQKCSNSSEPPGISLDPAGNSQKTSLLLSVNQSNAKTGDEEKVIVANDFRDKLWNWEKVSSQKSEVSSVFLVASGGRKAFHLEEQKNVGVIAEEPRKHWEIKGAQTLSSQRPWMAKQKSLVPSEDSTSLLSHLGPDKNSDARICQPIYESELIIEVPEKQPAVRHHQLPKTKPLPSVESLGPPPAKPPKPPVVNLCAFQRQWATLPKTPREAAVEKSSLPPESAESEEPHNYEATISYLRHSGNSINLCATEEIAESIYEVEIDEPQKPWKSFLHQEHSFKHEDKDKRMKEKESHDWKLQKMEKDSHSKHPTKVSVSEETPGKDQMTNIHGGSHTLDGKQDAVTKAIHTRACPQDPKMAKHSQGHCGYADALAVTGGQGPCKPSPISEETYDDVDYPGREGSKSDFSHSLTSDNEENSGEMYEDVYKTKGNYPKIDLDGKEALNRLHRFFKKEKDKFKVKKTKSKENISGFSISLPNLDLRSQDVTIYDDVDTNEKESKDEDKLKTWKSKFLIPKESKEKNSEESESLSPRNFFRIKKQNLKKNRMEREEKLFRERFEYDKEITVINTAVTCSSNSRNGMFDLPITTGEQLQVIDVTEENQVICRNSKGKYGYVLIEHLNFKHQGWSP